MGVVVLTGLQFMTEAFRWAVGVLFILIALLAVFWSVKWVLDVTRVSRAARKLRAEGVGFSEDIHQQTRFTPKTRAEDCFGCWCNTCGNIFSCQNARDDIDPTELPTVDAPWPCHGCANGMRRMPKEEEPCSFTTGYFHYEDAGAPNFYAGNDC